MDRQTATEQWPELSDLGIVCVTQGDAGQEFARFRQSKSRSSWKKPSPHTRIRAPDHWLTVPDSHRDGCGTVIRAGSGGRSRKKRRVALVSPVCPQGALGQREGISSHEIAGAIERPRRSCERRGARRITSHLNRQGSTGWRPRTLNSARPGRVRERSRRSVPRRRSTGGVRRPSRWRPASAPTRAGPPRSSTMPSRPTRLAPGGPVQRRRGREGRKPGRRCCRRRTRLAISTACVGSCSLCRQVVSEFARGRIEGLRNVNHGEDARISLTMLDVNEAAKAQVTSFGELFEAVAAFFPDSADLHSQRQEAGVWCGITVLHNVTPLVVRSEHHEQLCIITCRGGKSCP